MTTTQITTTFEAVTNQLGCPNKHVCFAGTAEECRELASLRNRDSKRPGAIRVREVVIENGAVTAAIVRNRKAIDIDGDTVVVEIMEISQLCVQGAWSVPVHD